MKKRLHVPPAMRHYFGAAGIALLIIAGSLAIGVLGYRYFNGEGWVDALVDASMILAGMGPVGKLENDTAKIFASGYALFSGFIVVASVAVIVTPWLHLFLHRLDKQHDEE